MQNHSRIVPLQKPITISVPNKNPDLCLAHHHHHHAGHRRTNSDTTGAPTPTPSRAPPPPYQNITKHHHQTSPPIPPNLNKNRNLNHTNTTPKLKIKTSPICREKTIPHQTHPNQHPPFQHEKPHQSARKPLPEGNKSQSVKKKLRPEEKKKPSIRLLFLVFPCTARNVQPDSIFTFPRHCGLLFGRDGFPCLRRWLKCLSALG